MSYTKKNWVNGEIITQEELNRIESYLNTFNSDPDPIVSLDSKIISDISEDTEVIICTLNRIPSYVMVDLNQTGVPGEKFPDFSNFDTCFCSNIFADSHYKPTITQSDTLDVILFAGEGIVPSSYYSEFTKVEEGIYRSNYIGTSSSPALEYAAIDTTTVYRWDHSMADVYLKFSEESRHDRVKSWLPFCKVIIPFNKEYLKILNDDTDESFIDNLDFEIYNKILIDLSVGISTLTNQETLTEYLNRRNEVLNLYNNSLVGTPLNPNISEDLVELINKLYFKFPLEVFDTKYPSTLYKDIISLIKEEALSTDKKGLDTINSDSISIDYTCSEDFHKTVINDSYILSEYVENDRYMYDAEDYTNTIDYLFYFIISETCKGSGAASTATCNTLEYNEYKSHITKYAGNLSGDAVIIYGLYNSETDTVGLYRSIHTGISFTPNFEITVSNTISNSELSFDVSFEDFYGNRFSVGNITNNTGLELRVYGAVFINLKSGDGVKFLKNGGFYHLYNNFYLYNRYSTIGQNGNLDTLSLQTINVVNIPNENNRNIENLSKSLIRYIGNNIQYFKYLSNTADTYNNSTYFTYPKVELGEALT